MFFFIPVSQRSEYYSISKNKQIIHVTIPWSHNCIKMTSFKIERKTWEKAFAAAAGEMRHGD